VAESTCPVCAGMLPQKGPTGPRPMYCSKMCRRRAEYLRRKADGTAYRLRDKGTASRPCIECGIEFEAKRDDAALCSSTCSNRRRRRTTVKRCSESGCDRRVEAKGLCKTHWRRAARADGREKPEPWNERRRQASQRRRALKKGATAEKVNNLAVFERDGWVCGICSRPVDQDVSWPDPMSPSLDHILPLSRGGAHAMSNVQLAHLACNVSKGARVA